MRISKGENLVFGAHLSLDTLLQSCIKVDETRTSDVDPLPKQKVTSRGQSSISPCCKARSQKQLCALKVDLKSPKA